jgi:hypothetical protein
MPFKGMKGAHARYGPQIRAALLPGTVMERQNHE